MLNDPNLHHWSAPDLDDDKLDRVKEIAKELGELFPAPTALTKEDVANLTEAQAEMVRIHTRRALLHQLLFQEFHMHEMDDCGDYLTAATDNWAALFNNLWSNDFQDEVEETKKFLTDFDAYPEGGSDGEVRYDLIPWHFDEQEDDDA